jgi:hypothetical protein
MPCLKHYEGLVKHVHKNKSFWGLMDLQLALGIKLMMKDANFKFNNFFIDVWYVPCAIESKHYLMHLHFIYGHCPS